MSLGSLTYHFTSQTELLRESLGLYVEEEVIRLEAIAAELRARHPAPGEVAAEVQRLVAESAGRPQQVAELELHLQAARDAALREVSARCFAAYEAVAVAALAALHIDDPERHAPAVVALMMGMSLRREGTGVNDAGAFVDALRTILRGARRQGRTRPSGHSSAGA